MNAPRLDNVGQFGRGRGNDKRAPGMLHARHDGGIEALEQHDLAFRELAQLPRTIREGVRRAVGRNRAKAAADLTGTDDDRVRREGHARARRSMWVAHSHRHRRHRPDALDGRVVEVVLAAVPGSALTAGLVLALKASVEPPTPASNEAAQTMAMLGIAKRLAAFLGPVIEPTFRRAKRQMPGTPPVPRVISTKEFAGAPVLGTKPFFGADLTWSEA